MKKIEICSTEFYLHKFLKKLPYLSLNFNLWLFPSGGIKEYKNK